MLLSLSLTIVMAASVFAVPMVAAPNAGPAGFNVTSLDFLGTGCPHGTPYYVLNAERTALTVSFSEFYVEIGPGIPISRNRKACQLSLGVSVPPGFTFAISSVDYQGYYQLDSKVKVTHSMVCYFKGELVQDTAQSEVVGPLEGTEYTWRDTFDLGLGPTIQAPCGSSTVLNVNSDIRISNSANPEGQGYLATNCFDPSLVIAFNLQWQRC
ncbi:hypothetical protein DFP72DRAFT_893128 [Ephemerocybe angulata]|uniref:Secreted protein n=1 Tax=Ephemerocybe angulata TaxID=980116 RepID=A0A8H6I287_9AGAR|nr:hypothetical protein DFP72DRAFT_893128 [Tulosesus angulatus]